MLPFIVAGVFVVASAAGWLLLFPPKRRPSRRQRRMLLIGAGTALLAGMPPLLVRLLRPQQMLPAFDDSSRPVDQQIAALLQGEQLVPPPPLPPLAFSTAEVELLRPMLSQADRDWQRLDQDFARRLAGGVQCDARAARLRDGFAGGLPQPGTPGQAGRDRKSCQQRTRLPELPPIRAGRGLCLCSRRQAGDQRTRSMGDARLPVVWRGCGSGGHGVGRALDHDGLWPR